MNNQLVLVCEHHHNDLVFFRYDWSRQVSVPPLLVLETGGETLAFLRKYVETYAPVPNLIICELNLPDCSGLEILNYIKCRSCAAGSSGDHQERAHEYCGM